MSIGGNDIPVDSVTAMGKNYLRLIRLLLTGRQMTLEPLLNAPFVVQLHALPAVAAFGLGIVQLTAPKGTL
jgi:hypothetical protein